MNSDILGVLTLSFFFFFFFFFWGGGGGGQFLSFKGTE